MADDAIYQLDAETVLEDFVRHYPLPQRAKVTEGFYDESSSEDNTFSTGDVVVVSQITCPAVNVTFNHNGVRCHASFPVNHPARFFCAPAAEGKGLKYPMIRDLVRIWPIEAKTTVAYNHPRDKRKSFDKNERLTLIRLVSICGIQFLECKFKRRQRLLQLPMDCEGHFEIIKDHRVYTLEEIIYRQPPRRRVLTLVQEELINQRFPLPEVPVGFQGQITMEKPGLLVEIFPCDSPGDVFAVTVTTPITLSPREETYTGAFRIEYPIQHFVTQNSSRLPMHVTIASWKEVTAVCDRMCITPGSGVILHQLNDVPKILAEGGGFEEYYAIPLNYQKKLRIEPMVYEGMVELYEASLKGPIVVEVTKAASRRSILPGIYTAKQGDIIRCSPGKREPYRIPNSIDEISVIVLELLHHNTHAVTNIVMADESMDGEFTEVLNQTQLSVDSLSKIHLLELPVPLRFVSGGDAKVETAQDGVPLNKPLLVTYTIAEPCVIAQKDQRNCKSYNLPLRTDLSIVLEKTLQPAAMKGKTPVMAFGDSLGEQIRRTTYDRLLQYKMDAPYEAVTDTEAPGVPIRRSTSSSGESGKRRAPPPLPPGHKDYYNQGDKGYLEARTDQHKPSVQTQEEEGVYDIIYDYADMRTALYGASKPNITIPPDSNISHYNDKEMLVLLEHLNIPADAISAFAKLKCTGTDFASLTNEDLEQFGVKSPLTVHFRDRTRHAIKTKFL